MDFSVWGVGFPPLLLESARNAYVTLSPELVKGFGFKAMIRTPEDLEASLVTPGLPAKGLGKPLRAPKS